MICNFLSALREVGLDPFVTLKVAHCSSDYNRIKYTRKGVALITWKQTYSLVHSSINPYTPIFYRIANARERDYGKGTDTYSFTSLDMSTKLQTARLGLTDKNIYHGHIQMYDSLSFTTQHCMTLIYHLLQLWFSMPYCN